MNHKFEIQQHADGKWSISEVAPGGLRFRAGPFSNLELAEIGMRRIIDNTIRKYDDKGEPVE